MVRIEGFEPPTSCSQSKRSAKLNYILMKWMQGKDLNLRSSRYERDVLDQAKLPCDKVVGIIGVEPIHRGFQAPMQAAYIKSPWQARKESNLVLMFWRHLRSTTSDLKWWSR